MPLYLHDDLRPILAGTHGVVVFHEQVIEMIPQFTGCTLAEADEARRALGDVEGMADTRLWFFPRALARGYAAAARRAGLEGARGVRVVRLLQGARRGVRAADLPVGLAQGALPGALPVRGAHPRPRHVPQAADPRRRPAARHRGPRARRQRLRGALRRRAGRPADRGGAGTPGVDTLRWSLVPVLGELPPWTGVGCGIRLSLAEVKGITEAEVARIVAARGPPYDSLTDFWQRARVSRPVAERLVLAGAFDTRLRHRRHRRPAPPRPGHPARPAAPGGRPRPARPGAGPGRARSCSVGPASGTPDPDRGPGDGGPSGTVRG